MKQIDSPVQQAFASESAVVARTAARLLESGRIVDVASTLTTIAVLFFAIALVVFHRAPAHLMWLLVATVALGLIQKYYAVRVAFDASLFTDLADTFQQAILRDNNKPLIEMDGALAVLGLRTMSEGSPRSLAERMAGATRMLRIQAMCLILQWLALVIVSAIQS